MNNIFEPAASPKFTNAAEAWDFVKNKQLIAQGLPPVAMDLLQHVFNLGIAGGLNLALLAASGDKTAFLAKLKEHFNELQAYIHVRDAQLKARQWKG